MQGNSTELDCANRDKTWMTIALSEAVSAMSEGEIPIATVLVGGDTEAIRSQTQVVRRGSLVAHGETCAFLDLGPRIWGIDRPITLYTTCEPCVMCLGAAMQYELDRIVFAMRAAPDGGVAFVDDYRRAGLVVPDIVGGVLESEAVELMREYLRKTPEALGADYVRALLEPYTQSEQL